MSVIRVTSVNYTTADDGELLVLLAGRGMDGARRTHTVTDTEPWIFVPASADVPERSYIQRVERETDDGPYQSFDGKPVKKVVTNTPKQAGDLADEYNETWESDIPYYRRVSIHDGLSGYIDVPDRSRVSIHDIGTDPDFTGTIEPRVLMADIEVIPDTSVPFEEFTEEGKQPIINISTYDTYEEQYTAFVLSHDDYDFDTGQVKKYLEGHWRGVVDNSDEFKELTSGINVEICPSEETLLRRFIFYVADIRPDLISGWNWVDFDHRYILNRIRRLRDDGLDVPVHSLTDIGTVSGWATERAIDGLPGFDMMDAFCGKMAYSDWRSTALDFVASEELDIGKIPAVNIKQDFKQDREKLAAYNIIDTQLCVELDKKNGIHQFFYDLAELSQVPIYDTFSEMRLVDGFIMSRRTHQEVLPAAEEKELEANAGGLVLEPFHGMEEWVGVFDLKSLYPSSIITWNISTETLLVNDTDDEEYLNQVADIIVPTMPDPGDVKGRIHSDDISWSRMGITMSRQGIIPKYLRLLFAERESRKEMRNEQHPDSSSWQKFDRQQAAVKVLMNSFYGVASNNYWRLAREGMGDAITSAARYVLWMGAEIAREYDRGVLYGDTDSIFVPLNGEGDDAVADGRVLSDALNGDMEAVADNIGIGEVHPYLVNDDLHGSDRHCLYWEFEKLYQSYLQAGKKKRYCGLKVWSEGEWIDEPDADLVGFETQRSDSPMITEEYMKTITRMVLEGRDFADISRYLQDRIQAIKDGDVEPYMAAMPGVLKRPISQYKTSSPTIRACQYSNEHLGHNWQRGDSPWIYYVKDSPAWKRTDVIALDWNDDIPDGYVLDVDTIVEKALAAPLDPILEVAGFDFTELKAGGTTGDALEGGWGSSSDDDVGQGALGW